jgi:hypothetical protein
MNFSIGACTKAVFVIGAACAAAVACADATVGPDDPGPSNTTGDASPDDASNVIPADANEGEADDASVDASTPEDSGDAGPKKLCTVEGWCHTELPPKQTLRGVWGDGTGVIWSVSEEGNVLRWDGTAWSIVHTVTGKLFTVWGSTPTDIWIGGESGIFHGTGPTSAALTWTQFTTDGTPILSIWGSSTNDVYAVGNNGTVSRVLHYAGPPSDPAAPAWAPDPVLGNVTGKLAKIWGNSATDVWTVGAIKQGFDRAFIWHLSPNDAGTPTFTQDTTFNVFLSNIVRGGFIADPNNRLWFGKNGSFPYMMWGRRTDSTKPFTWTDAFVGFPEPSGTCQSQVHNGILVFGPNDIWKYGELGRLCHFDGTRWSLPIISIEVPFVRTFWDAWAPNGDPSGMWVVGDQVALRKQPVNNP